MPDSPDPSSAFGLTLPPVPAFAQIGRRLVPERVDQTIAITDPDDPSSYTLIDAPVARPTAGVIIPPGTTAIYWEDVNSWFSDGYSIGQRFTVDSERHVSFAVLPSYDDGTSAGTIEVSIHRVVTDLDSGSLYGVKIATSGVLDWRTEVDFAVASANYGRAYIPITATLPPGQYLAMVWADASTNLYIKQASINTRMQDAHCLSYDIASTGGAPNIGQLYYTTRSVAITLEETRTDVDKAVLLGDSITEQQLWFAGAMGLTGIQYRVVNAGNAGETSTQILARYSTDVSPENPDLVVILAGTNDIGATTPIAGTIIANLRNMYDRALAAGYRVIACTIPPRFASAGPVALSVVQRTALNTVNTWIRSLTDVHVCDWTVQLSTGDGITPDTAYFTDHVHPNAAGAYLMAQILDDVLVAAS